MLRPLTLTDRRSHRSNRLREAIARIQLSGGGDRTDDIYNPNDHCVFGRLETVLVLASDLFYDCRNRFTLRDPQC